MKTFLRGCLFYLILAAFLVICQIHTGKPILIPAPIFWFLTFLSFALGWVLCACSNNR